MKKIFIIALLLIVLAGGGYYFVQQVLRDPARLVKALPEVVKQLEFELDNVRYGHTRSGVKKWELSTRKAKRIKGQDRIILEGVTARIYADGKLESDTRIEAENGFYLVESGDIELQGSVKIINQQLQIKTERLSYQEAKEEILAPESLVVESEKLTIKANRATIDLKQQQLHFSGSVKARIRPGKISDVAENGSKDEKTGRKVKPEVDIEKFKPQ
ncbi:MAG TPA: LPS export ABC transporter periplasmic protein LptC [Desulfarculaceae bacterium]|nr:LPS export ABC transporter periplasmic protein LptC [Desulfarculaceae bacterium]